MAAGPVWDKREAVIVRLTKEDRAQCAECDTGYCVRGDKEVMGQWVPGLGFPGCT